MNSKKVKLDDVILHGVTDGNEFITNKLKEYNEDYLYLINNDDNSYIFLIIEGTLIYKPIIYYKIRDIYYVGVYDDHNYDYPENLQCFLLKLKRAERFKDILG